MEGWFLSLRGGLSDGKGKRGWRRKGVGLHSNVIKDGCGKESLWYQASLRKILKINQSLIYIHEACNTGKANGLNI